MADKQGVNPDGSLAEERYERFCLEYVKDGNAAASYLRSGFSAKSTLVASASSARLLAKASITARIKALSDSTCQRIGIEAGAIAEEMKALAFSRIDKAIDSSGMVKPFENMDGSTIAAIKEYDPPTYSPDGAVLKQAKIKMHDKAAALKHLSRLAGMELEFALAAVEKAGYLIVPPDAIAPIDAEANPSDAQLED